MQKESSFSQKINKKTKLIFAPIKADFDEKAELYAINWFNLKYPWLYKLYNLLVASRLKHVGGSLLFKGRHLEKLAGDDQLKRSMLLIVRYPSIQSFFGLITNKFFQIASILRIVSVADFNLGFMHSQKSLPTASIEFSDKHYLVLAFADQVSSSRMLVKLEELSNRYDFRISFSGQLAARLEVERKSKGLSKVPFSLDALVLLEKSGNFSELLSDDFLLKQFKSGYLATFERLA